MATDATAAVPEVKTRAFLDSIVTRAETHRWDACWFHGQPGRSTQQSQPDLSLTHGCGRWVVVKAFSVERMVKARRKGESGLQGHQVRIHDNYRKAGALVMVIAPTPEDDETLQSVLSCTCDTPEGANDCERPGEAGLPASEDDADGDGDT